MARERFHRIFAKVFLIAAVICFGLSLGYLVFGHPLAALAQVPFAFMAIFAAEANSRLAIREMNRTKGVGKVRERER